jgi:hypothetical protein
VIIRKNKNLKLEYPVNIIAVDKYVNKAAVFVKENVAQIKEIIAQSV